MTHDWDQQQWIAAAVGWVTGIALLVMGQAGIAEVGALLAALVLRWAMWQIPPPGRSAAVGAPADSASRLGQLAVAVILVVLTLDLLTAPLH